eukprot:2689873-Pyramimonas_sp.AAC.1
MGASPSECRKPLPMLPVAWGHGEVLHDDVHAELRVVVAQLPKDRRKDDEGPLMLRRHRVRKRNLGKGAPLELRTHSGST